MWAAPSLREMICQERVYPAARIFSCLSIVLRPHCVEGQLRGPLRAGDNTLLSLDRRAAKSNVSADFAFVPRTVRSEDLHDGRI